MLCMLRSGFLALQCMLCSIFLALQHYTENNELHPYISSKHAAGSESKLQGLADCRSPPLLVARDSPVKAVP